jgi:hypothetical protein
LGSSNHPRSSSQLEPVGRARRARPVIAPPAQQLCDVRRIIVGTCESRGRGRGCAQRRTAAHSPNTSDAGMGDVVAGERCSV